MFLKSFLYANFLSLPNTPHVLWCFFRIETVIFSWEKCSLAKTNVTCYPRWGGGGGGRGMSLKSYCCNHKLITKQRGSGDCFPQTIALGEHKMFENGISIGWWVLWCRNVCFCNRTTKNIIKLPQSYMWFPLCRYKISRITITGSTLNDKFDHTVKPCAFWNQPSSMKNGFWENCKSSAV